VKTKENELGKGDVVLRVRQEDGRAAEPVLRSRQKQERHTIIHDLHRSWSKKDGTEGQEYSDLDRNWPKKPCRGKHGDGKCSIMSHRLWMAKKR
jgi:hypothetical protein